PPRGRGSTGAADAPDRLRVCGHRAGGSRRVGPPAGDRCAVAPWHARPHAGVRGARRRRSVRRRAACGRSRAAAHEKGAGRWSGDGCAMTAYGPDALGIPQTGLPVLRELVHERTGMLFDADRMEMFADRLAPLVVARGFRSFLDLFYLLKYDEA